MNRRKVRARTTTVAAVGLFLAIMSPAWADCCSSILGCAATYVTDGLSCEIETIIDTINTLATLLVNFVHDVDGQTQTAEQNAKQSVSDTYNAMLSQSQQSESDLAAALSQAQILYKEETSNRAYEAQSAAQQQSQLTTAASGTPAPPRPQVEARAGQPTTSGGPPLAMTAQRNPDLTTASGQTNPLTQKSAVDVGTQVGVAPDMVTTPKGTFADAFSRAIQQITALKNTGDSDFSKVNRSLQQALNSEGPGIDAANTVINVVDSPLNALSSQLSSMLTHPWSAFDPSSVVDQIEATVTADLSSNITQLVGDITNGPNDAFNAAQPAYDDLLANAQAAQALLAVMTDAYQRRTPAAANALYAALPKRQFQGLDTKDVAGSAFAANNSATKFGQRVPFAVISAKMATVQQRAKLAYKAPSTSQIHLAVAQFKAQRAQGKTLPQATLAAYKTKLSQQFDGVFSGKSSAAIASQRDQLISQAKSQFAKDPSTENAVIGLLNSEASRRTGTASNATTNPTVPGQPVATTLGQRSAVSSNVQTGLTAPVSSFNQPAPSAPAAVAGWTRPAAGGAPAMNTGATLANPTVPGQPVAALPQIAAPVVQPAAQTKTPVWGAAPIQGWTPPAAPTAPAAPATAPAPAAATTPGLSPAFRMQTVKPAQQPTQPSQAAPTAPSNL